MKTLILYFIFCVVVALIIALIMGWNFLTGIPHVGFWPYLFQ